MHSSPSKPLIAGNDCPWLPPISFGVKPYLKLCKSFNRELRKLEARFPSPRPLLTLEARAKRLKRKPK